MNLIKVTQSKIDYCEQRILDLKDCLSKDFMTIDAIIFINKELDKTVNNKKYFKEIMEVLKND